MKQQFYTSLSDKVYNRLLADILSGCIPVGEKLGEDAISAKMKVSRTPVREAIHRLTQEGIIERIPRCGCFVKKQNRDEVREIFECRQLMECYALTEGFDNIEKNRLTEMTKLVDELGEITSEEEIDLSLKLDDLLHALVIEVCPNQLIKGMILKLQQQSNPFRTFRSLDEKEITNITAERAAIIKAISKGDKKQAVTLLREHIQVPLIPHETN